MPVGKPTKDLFNRFFWVVLAFGILANQPQKRGSYSLGGSVSESKARIRGPKPYPTRPAPNREANVQQRLQALQRFVDPNTGEIPSNVRALEVAFTRHMQRRQAGSLQARQEENWNVQARGPMNLGGRTRALGVDVRNDSIIVAGGVSGGMWKSTNQGESWEYTSLPVHLPSVTCLVQDTRPGKEDNWYYGTGEFTGNSASSGQAPFLGDGVFQSTNNGDSWDQIRSTITYTNSTNLPPTPFNYVHRLALDVSNLVQDELYAAVPYGIIRTVDGFNTWSYVLGGNPTDNNRNWTEVMTTPSGRVYATISNEQNQDQGPSGIFTSVDGINWQNITPTTRYDGTYRRIVMAYAPSAEHIVYFMGESGNVARLHQYNQLTDRWVDLTDQIPNIGGLIGKFDPQGSYNMVVAVHPTSENTVLIGATNIHISTNGFSSTVGTRWIGGYSSRNDFSQFENHHADQHALIFDSQNRLVSGHDGGVSILEDVLDPDIAWRSLNNGYGTVQAHSVAVSTLDWGSTKRLAGFQDLGSYFTDSENPEDPWEPVGTGDGGFSALTPNSLLISWQHGQLFRYGVNPNSDQLNGEEQNISPTGAGSFENFRYVTPWGLDPDRPNRLFLAGEAGLWRLDDITQPFERTDWDFVEDRELFGDISALGFAMGQPELWVGTELGRLYQIKNHLQPQINFEPKESDIFPERAYISSVAVHPNRAGEVWVSFSNYGVNSLFRSLDGGDTWKAVGGNLDESIGEFNKGPGVTWVSIVARENESFYFVGTTAGLYFATEIDGQNTNWSPVGITEIGVAVIDMITPNPVDGTVLVATHGKGLFEFQIPDIREPRVAVIGPDPVCLEESTVLYASRYRNQGRVPVQYQWFKNGELLDNENGFILNTEEPGKYFATILIDDGTPLSRTSLVTLPEKVPDAFELIRRNDSLVVLPDCEGCQYEWVRDDNSSVAITSDPTLFVGGIQIDGTYRVRVTRGCDPVESNSIVVDGITLQPGETDKLVIVPNPAEDFITLKVLASEKQVLGARLYSLNGQLVGEKNDGAWNEWDLSGLGRGMYQMTIFGEEGIISSSLLMKR